VSTTELKVGDVKIVTAAVIDQWPKDSWGISGTIVGNLHDIGREIRARVDKLNQLGGKAVDMVDSINHLLEDARKLCDEEGFEAFKRVVCPDLGQSRAYELLAIKEGRKTLEEIREAGRIRVAKHRAEKKARVTEKDSVTSLPAKVKVNGQPIKTDELGPAAQEQIARALAEIEPEATPEELRAKLAKANVATDRMSEELAHIDDPDTSYDSAWQEVEEKPMKSLLPATPN
jgi:hypothetical protein